MAEYSIIVSEAFSIEAKSEEDALDWARSVYFDPEAHRVQNSETLYVQSEKDFFYMVARSRFENRNVAETVRKYFEFREYEKPDMYEALAFLMSEIGELADAINELQPKAWIRNHPDAKKSANVLNEAGDVLMMLAALLWHFNADPVEAMIQMMKEKGFEREE